MKRKNILYIKMLGLLLICLVSAQIIILSEAGLGSFPGKNIKEVLTQPVYYLVPTYRAEDSSFSLQIIYGADIRLLSVIVNNKVVAEFAGNDVTVPIKDGDMVWIDGRGVKDPVWVRITETTGNTFPLIKGREFRIQGELLFLGEINQKSRL